MITGKTIDAPRKKINPPKMPEDQANINSEGDFIVLEIFNHLKELIYFFNSSWKSKNNHTITFLDDESPTAISTF